MFDILQYTFSECPLGGAAYRDCGRYHRYLYRYPTHGFHYRGNYARLFRRIGYRVVSRYQSHIGSIAFCRRFGIGSRVAFPAWNRKRRFCNRYVVGFGHGGGNNLYFQDARICSRVERVSFWEYTYRNVVRSRLVCTLYSIASSVVGIVLSLSYRCRVRSRLCFYPAVTGTAYRLYDGCNGVVVCGIDDTVGRHNASFVDVPDITGQYFGGRDFLPLQAVCRDCGWPICSTYLPVHVLFFYLLLFMRSRVAD